ncbi:endonuclease [Mycoplasma struthionis]|uniref:Ribonuclease n=1 Tax=Mycoplasma struthionis TaxID=538220 RepID=A0A502M2L6_9MOLU|nr:endonuclease [Mycoplasma struthionis]TPI03098.1 ribonuclease [Mycoplasma struthionis]
MKKNKLWITSLFLSASAVIAPAAIAMSCNKNNDSTKTNNNSNNTQGTNPGSTNTTDTNNSEATNLLPKASSSENLVYNNQDSYYASLEGLKGDQLRNQLFTLQKNSTGSIPDYNYLYTTYRDAFVDKYYEKDGSVLDIYSEKIGKDPQTYTWKSRGSSAKGEGDGINREHIIPQSWFDKQSPMRNDAHHVWPTDIFVNKEHSNYPYGIVKADNFVSKNGTKVGNGEEDNGLVTEPADLFKGDVARAILYFTDTYQDKNLEATNESRRLYKRVNNRETIKDSFKQTYLKWNKEDPVDQFDLDRNNGIYKHQRNRNPFIDYPELVDVVFNNNNDYVFHNKGIAISVKK